jgi:hypothetical protein
MRDATGPEVPREEVGVREGDACHGRRRCVDEGRWKVAESTGSNGDKDPRWV